MSNVVVWYKGNYFRRRDGASTPESVETCAQCAAPDFDACLAFPVCSEPNNLFAYIYEKEEPPCAA